MIDIDAIKAEGRNDAEHSAQLLLMHVWRERVRLHGDLCAQFLRENQGTSSGAFSNYCRAAADEVHRRVRIPLFEAALS